MPWFALDTHYLEDPKVQAAGEMTPFALSVFPALLADAKQRADGGKVEVVFRSLAFRLFISEEEASKAIRALVSAGVRPQLQGRFPLLASMERTLPKGPAEGGQSR